MTSAHMQQVRTLIPGGSDTTQSLQYDPHLLLPAHGATISSSSDVPHAAGNHHQYPENQPTDLIIAPSAAHNRKLACPFYKHNPDKYRSARGCLGPGWDNVHRVKGHLYRRHMLPKHECIRCHKDLVDTESLSKHLRNPVPCDISTIASKEGIDARQEAALKSRKKTHGSTPRKKWEAVYRILFPGENVPSPYYEDGDINDSQVPERSSGSTDEHWQYIGRELGPLIQRELNSLSENELTSGARDKIIAMVHGVVPRLRQSFEICYAATVQATRAHSPSHLPTSSISNAPPTSPYQPTPGPIPPVPDLDADNMFDWNFSGQSGFTFTEN